MDSLPYKLEYLKPSEEIHLCLPFHQYCPINVLSPDCKLIGLLRLEGLECFPSDGLKLYVRWRRVMGLVTPLSVREINIAIEVNHYRNGGTDAIQPHFVDECDDFSSVKFERLTPEELAFMGQFRSIQREVPVSVIRREMRMMLAPGSHTKREWREVMQRDGWKCLRCGSTKRLSKDHVVPIAGGGTNGADNLQTLCTPCNSWKGARHIDFRPQAEVIAQN